MADIYQDAFSLAKASIPSAIIVIVSTESLRERALIPKTKEPSSHSTDAGYAVNSRLGAPGMFVESSS